MNVLIIAQFFPPYFGGASTRAYNVAKSLVLQGCTVTVITAFPRLPNSKNSSKHKRRLLYTEEFEGMNLIRTRTANPTDSPWLLFLLYISFVFTSLLALHHVKKIDVIFAMNPMHFSVFSALAYKIVFNKKIIGSVDDLWPEVFYDSGAIKSTFIRKFLDFVALVSYKLQSAIIPVSPGYVSTLISKYRIPERKIIVIEAGVDSRRFEAIKNPKNSNEKKIVMYSGYMGHDYYDMDIVIKAASHLRSENILFVLRGFGGDNHKIEQMIESNNLDNLELRTEILSKDEAISAMKAADIFLLPLSQLLATDRGLPTKIFEYQALGKPIICISKGESANYITKTKSGLLMTSNDPSVLAGLIMKLANDKELAYRLGRNGRDYVRNNITLEKLGERLIKVIQKTS